MTELRVTVCDRCNPAGRLDTADGRGYVLRSAADALALGWEREPGSHIDGSEDTHYCIACLDEEIASGQKRASDAE